MQTIFTVLRYPTIKQKPKLRLNGIAAHAIIYFRIFNFLLLWYDRAWQFISEKYNFTLCFSFFRYLILELEQLKQPVTKYFETNTSCKGFPLPPAPLPPPFINLDGSANYTETTLRTNY